MSNTVNFSEFVDMSQNKQQNNTKLNMDYLIAFILKRTKMPYTETDYERAKNIFQVSQWHKINMENVTEYVAEAWDRFMGALDRLKINNYVCYFFGILRKLLATTTAGDMRRAYRQFLESENRTDPRVFLDHQPPSPDNDDEPEQDEPLSEEWQPVYEALEKIEDKHAFFEVHPKVLRETVTRLQELKVNPVHTTNALNYLCENDRVSANYMIQHIRDMDIVVKTLEKNYRRYLAYPDGYTPGKKKVKVKPSGTKQDERYKKFWDLFE